MDDDEKRRQAEAAMQAARAQAARDLAAAQEALEAQRAAVAALDAENLRAGRG
ncbi:hypothetical protein [Streptomyces sp. H39-C1]|uniref:hypothetical protein n=1 Tax=Streptomyces sp. H39-C1 TaxID=3004355 RepID=UPI0022B0076C|nr:hypothetical protein [Streptomyces sp. H39-C1]MCZ4103544.1 hypothetical protein [Streptomyces sp. H39-C1]